MFYHVLVLYFFLSACDAGDQGLIPELGSSSGEGNGNPLQYPCLENPMDRGAWRATGHRVAESDPTERLTQTRNIQFCGYATFCLSTRQLIDI